MTTQRKPAQLLFTLLVILATILSAFPPAPASARQGDESVRRAYSSATGKLTFLGADPSAPFQADLAPGLSAEEIGLAYARQYGPEFGLQDAARELQLAALDETTEGRAVTRYQQVYRGIPVLAGELIVNAGTDGRLYSMNGEVSPGLDLSTTPAITAQAARDAALQGLLKWYSGSLSDYDVDEPALWILDERLLGPGTRPAHLVWRMQATSADGSLPLRELILVNAQDGNISLHFNQVDTSWGGGGLPTLSRGTEPLTDETPTETHLPTEPPVTPTETPLPTEPPLPTETPIPAETPLPTETEIPVEVPTLVPGILGPDSSVETGVDRFVAPIGTNEGDCSVSTAPCATINYAVGQASTTKLDTIKVAVGTYSGSGTAVVNVSTPYLALSGGWNASFDAQVGFSTLDGQSSLSGILFDVTTLPDAVGTIDHFIIRNGVYGIRNTCDRALIIRNSAVIDNTDIGITTYKTLRLSNVTVANNHGAILHSNGSYRPGVIATINNSTIANNISTVSSVAAGLRTSNLVYLSNSILSNNKNRDTSINCWETNSDASIISNGYNIIDNTHNCSIPVSTGDQFGTDPKLSVLLPEFGIIPLLADSPAVDAGGNDTCFGTADQRGVARYDGDGDTTVTCDVGAYEYMVPGSADHLTIAAGNGQNRAPSHIFYLPLSVASVDEHGSPAGGVEVTFTAPSSGPSGTFEDAGLPTVLLTTNSNGLAVTPLFKANDQSGSYTVTASSAVGSVDFSLHNSVWYVSPTGLDTNSCQGPDTPCGTINGTIKKAGDGSAIYIAEGTYYRSDDWPIAMAEKNLVLQGGWDAATFTLQEGYSTLDGQKQYIGAYVMENLDVEMRRFIIRNCKTPSISFPAGMENEGNLVMEDVIIEGNNGIGFGNGGTLELNHAVISDNLGTGLVNDGTLSANDVVIRGNTSVHYPGGAIRNDGLLTLSNSSLSGNLSSYDGGGISNTGTLNLNNLTISSNSASTIGGGINNSGGTLRLNNVTVSNNNASSGGGIYGRASLKNTIVSGNSASTTGPDCRGTLTSTGHNIIGDTSGCTITPLEDDQFNVDPQLGPFILAGGFHPIASTSPARDNGSDCYGTTDQRGAARDAFCDIGAYEYTTPGSPAGIAVAGGAGQSARPGTAFPQRLKAVVLDDAGTPVSGQLVTFTAPVDGATLTFDGVSGGTVTILTNANGVATSPSMTASAEYGDYIVTATTDGVAAVADFSLANAAWFVSTSGLDTNDCRTPSTACGSIAYAIGKAPAGETISISTGTYSTSADDISIAKDIILQGGWNNSFTNRNGYSTIDGDQVYIEENANVSLDAFIVQNVSENPGVYNRGTLSLSNCKIRRNGGGVYGGGIYNLSKLTVTGCEITYNLADIGGGIYNVGPYNTRGSLVVVDSVISDNYAKPMSAGALSTGGGIYNGGTLEIRNSNVLRNRASWGAGIYNVKGSTLDLFSTSVSQNTGQVGVGGGGGGIFAGGTIKLNNATINNNFGSGIYTYGQTTVTMNNVTMNGNQGQRGGGIYIDPDSTSYTITFKNSIIAGNLSTENKGKDCYGRIKSQGYNILGSTESCTVTAAAGDHFNTNPMLGTFLPVPGYQPLRVGSPAINSANPATCLPTDQRGLARVGTCDIGAYEYARPGKAARILLVSGNAQNIEPGGLMSDPMRVVVLDARGTPVGGVRITFTAPAAGPGGTFSSTGTVQAVAVTDVTGMASSPAFVANDQFGGYMVTAAASGVGNVKFELTNFVWFVSTTGRDTNTCTSSVDPCASLAAVLNKLGFLAGDVVWVVQGTYLTTDYTTASIYEDVTIRAGWDPTFTTRPGVSTFNKAFVIYKDTTVVLEQITVENTKSFWGTGIVNLGGLLTIRNSTIRNNLYGLHISGGRTFLINSTVTGNGVSNDGCGIQNESKGDSIVLTIVNSTISENRGYYIGGICNSREVYHKRPIELVNSIVAGNIGLNRSDCGGLIISGGYNLIGSVGNPNASDCFGDWQATDRVGNKTTPIPVSKILGSLKQDPLSGYWYYPLKLGSLALDAGSPAAPGSGGNACPAVDQLGVTRPQNARCDIGAVEFNPARSPDLLLTTYDANHTRNLPGAKVCDQTDLSCAAGTLDARNAHKFAKGLYDFYLSRHSRLSLDDKGQVIYSTVRYGSGYDDAFWNGYMLVYGDAHGYVRADDIAAHELTHAVTQYSSNLFSYYQSGAISESLSDLWGEAYDQLGNVTSSDTSAAKWLIGEDVTGAGPFRSMKNPIAYNDPDKMTSAYYDESSADNGGIHTNSGLNNKAAYLMIAGGAFNGKTVKALGWNKVLTIYYEAQTHLLTSGSDYLDLYNALYQSCLNKVGVDGILSSDCREVRYAAAAVEMDRQPALNYNPDVPDCPTGSRLVTTLFSDGLESSTGRWSFAGLFGRSAWGLSSSNAASGDRSLWADDSYLRSDSYAAMKSGVTLRANTKPFLHFTHAYNFDSTQTAYYDGGVLEYSINNGQTWLDAAPLFNAGKDYSGKILSGTGNLLSGRFAFVGYSRGYVDSRYYLAKLIGHSVRFRWRLATDKSHYTEGWYLDDVRIYTCGN